MFPRCCLLIFFPLFPITLRAEEPARTDAHGDPLPAGALMRLGTNRLVHDGGVGAVAFAPNGKALASAGKDGTIRVWDVGSGRAIRIIPEAGSKVHSLAYSSDGKTLASADWDKGVRLWDTASGKEVRQFAESKETVGAVMFSPDGKLLAAGQSDKKVRIWERESGKCLHRLSDKPDKRTLALAFSPNGKSLATAGEQEFIALWDIQTGQLIRRCWDDLRFSGQIEAIAFSPDGKQLYSSNPKDAIRTWSVSTGKLGMNIDTYKGGSALAVSADGRTLAAVSREEVRIYDLPIGALRKSRAFGEHDWKVTAAAFSANGLHIATGGEDHAIRLWDATKATEILPTGEPRVALHSLAYSTDGKAIHASSDIGYLQCWNAKDGTPIKRWSGKYSTLSHDGTKIVIHPTDLLKANAPPLEVLDTTTGKMITFVSTIPQKAYWPLSFSPDGRLLGLRGGILDDAVARVVDSNSGTTIWEWEKANTINEMIFSPDGQTLALTEGYNGDSVRLWNLAEKKESQRFALTRGVWKTPVFSLDGKMLAVPDNQLVHVWEVATGGDRITVNAHIQWNDRHIETITSVAIGPDGRTLATGSRERTVRLWDLATGQERHCFKGHHALIKALAFSPDGRHLASASFDTTVLIWDLSKLPPSNAAAEPMTADLLEKSWAELASKDARAAYHAIHRLARHPAQVLPLIRNDLQTVPQSNLKDVEAIIAALDDDDFDTRERATQELERTGRSIRTVLRQASIRGAASVEVRRRLERILQTLEAPPSGDELRRLRALEVVEQIGSTEARELLKTLTRGAPAGEITRDAKAALARLERRESR